MEKKRRRRRKKSNGKNVYPGTVEMLMAMRRQEPPESIYLKAKPFLEIIVSNEFRHSKMDSCTIQRMYDDCKAEVALYFVNKVLPKIQLEREDNEICGYVICSCRGIMKKEIGKEIKRQTYETPADMLGDFREKHDTHIHTDFARIDSEIDAEVVEKEIDIRLNLYLAMHPRPDTVEKVAKKIIAVHVYEEEANGDILKENRASFIKKLLAGTLGKLIKVDYADKRTLQGIFDPL